MTPEKLLIALISLSPLLFVKIFFLVILLFYSLFAVIIYRQIILMNQVVEAQTSPILKTIALVHLGGAVLIFLLALFLL